MQWSDVTKAPAPRMLRQFAGLWLVVFGGMAAWRIWNGHGDAWAYGLAAAAVVVGVAGLVWPAVVRPIYTAWMVVAFPIGWTVSHVALGVVFYVVFTAVGVVFRLTGRDVLRLRRVQRESYWMGKSAARSGEDYLRQY